MATGSATAIQTHRSTTKLLARSLSPTDVYHWLNRQGYFPETYVLPPCFRVTKSPSRAKQYFKVTKGKGGSTNYKPDRSDCVRVHFPKTELTDRTFGIINPRIHNDIAFHISRNWKAIVEALIPKDSVVTSYSFPIPVNAQARGRLGTLRSGRLIYEFIDMTDDDLVSVAYRYNLLVKADIKNFYPSVYTHSIAWALHGKKIIRKPKNLHNFNLLGNRLDKLFQNASDGCTNGIPIGPIVSDIIGEIIASGVDRRFSKLVRESKLDCVAVRFKDDYRVLVRDEGTAKAIIKLLQLALREFNLELSDEKTRVLPLPAGLFREWVSRYHAVHPRKKALFSWKQFRELYLAVVAIDRECPGTGVIDRFLADVVSKQGMLKLHLAEQNLEKATSMLLMLGTLRVKAFPKIMAILESILRTPFGRQYQSNLLTYLEEFLRNLSLEEERNKYLISWIMYFLVSNGLYRAITFRPKYKDPITQSVKGNRPMVFANEADFKLFLGSRVAGKDISMLEYLDVFDPPEVT